MVENIPPRQTWAALQAEPNAQLVDVRTDAEWAYVGLPDLSSLSRQVHCVEWQSFPSMAANPDFVAETTGAVEGAGAAKSAPILFLCRSGARSRRHPTPVPRRRQKSLQRAWDSVIRGLGPRVTLFPSRAGGARRRLD